MATTAKESQTPSGTSRRDLWWVQPLTVLVVLGGFIIYATYRTFENNFFYSPMHLQAMYDAGQVAYLQSPFYSPLIITDWRIFGYYVSPALLILPFPLSFRLTCYYYRKAYYRSFFWSPPACSVKGPVNRPGYTGEMKFPLVLQNFHRYAFYFAFVFIFILSYDVYKATWFGDGGWGVTVGTLVLLVNVALLAAYTFGCHSWRHLIGGAVDCYSCTALSRTRYGLWKKATFLNEKHAMWAWMSLFGVALADLYVRSVTAGHITDYILFKVGGNG